MDNALAVVNPKQINGMKKPPLGYMPLSAKLACSEALFDGRLKYGPHNWRDIPIEAETYIEAAFRHLELYKVGEDLTRDTLVKNLGSVMACCEIKLGRRSCRDRGCQYVWIWVGAGSLKKKK